MKVKEVVDDEGKFIGLAFNCPGCKDQHLLPIKPILEGRTASRLEPQGAHWWFNGDFDLPTFSPSISAKSGHFASRNKDHCWCTYNLNHPDEENKFECYICHSFVRHGRIEFLNDCTHSMAGMIVDLPDMC